MVSINRERFRELGALEKGGQFSEALVALQLGMRDAYYQDLAGLFEHGVTRIVERASNLSLSMDRCVEPIYENANNPMTYHNDSRPVDEKPLITLTTISTRIDRVAQTIATIMNQTLKPHSVNLYISDDPYLIDEGIPSDSDGLRKIADLGANIYNVKNIGPYRKQYPILYQLHRASADPMTPFITIDDDVLYPSSIVQTLMEALSSSNAVVSHRGRQITFRDNWFDGYGNFLPPTRRTSLLNIGTGRNGIAYRVKHFPMNYSAYCGPLVAPTADDLWCKFATAGYCIPTTILQPTAIFDTSLDFPEIAPHDKTGLFHNFNAKGKNDTALTALEMYFSHEKKGLMSLFGKENV